MRRELAQRQLARRCAIEQQRLDQLKKLEQDS